MSSESLPPHDLLEHAWFVRALARRLVIDEPTRDDIEQQTWLTALEHPPRHAGGIKSWLHRVTVTVAAKLHRGQERRTRRERAAARPESLPSPTEILQREAALRQIVDAVLELPDAYRDVVLLRYYEDMTPRDIARRLGVEATTVQSRLQRAHAALRVRLDRVHGGRRDEWRTLLLPFASVTRRTLSPVIALTAILVIVGIGLMSFTDSSAGDSSLDTSDRNDAATAPRNDAINGDVASVQRNDAGIEPEDGSAGRSIDPAETIRITGSVVDGERRVVSSGTARVILRDGTIVRGVMDQGRFSVDVPRVPASIGQDLAVILGDGEDAVQVAVARTGRSDSTIDLGAVVLRPAFTFALDTRPLGGEVEVWIRLTDHQRSETEFSERFDALVARASIGADGRFDAPSLPEGTYAVTCVSNDQVAGRCNVALPDDVWRPVVVTRSEFRRIEVTVVPEDSAPLEGRYAVRARRHVDGVRRVESQDRDPWRCEPVDDRGRAVLGDVDASETIRLVAVKIDDGIETVVSSPVIVPPQSSRATLMAHGDHDVPRLFGPIAVSTDRRIEPGWVADSDRRLDVRVVPEGRHARARFDEVDDRRALVFDSEDRFAVIDRDSPGDRSLEWRTGRFIDVVLRGRDGEPVVGQSMEARTHDGPFRIVRQASTDAAGRVRLGPFDGGLVDVIFGTRSLLSDFGMLAGQVDLEESEGDVELAIDFERAIDVTIEVSVDGRRALPSHGRPLVLGGMRSAVVADPEAATFRFRVWPDRSRREFDLIFFARDYSPANVRIDVPRDATAVVETAIEISSLVSVVGRLDATCDVNPAAVVLERLNPARGIFEPLGPNLRAQRADRSLVYEAASAGQYRWCDSETARVSDAFEVRTSPHRQESVIAFEALRLLDLDVSMPEGQYPGAVNLRFDDERFSAERRVRMPEGRMHATLRVPSGRSFRLVAEHDVLTCEDRSPIVVDAGTSRIEAAFVPSTLVSFDGPPPGAKARVILEDAAGRRLERSLEREGGEWLFGGHPAGVYTLLIDVAGSPPIRLEDVDLRADVVDLGEIAPASAASVIVRVVPRPHVKLPNVIVEARAAEGIPYVRRAASEGRDLVRLDGLAPGKHVLRIACHDFALGFPTITRVVEFEPGGVLEVSYP